MLHNWTKNDISFRNMRDEYMSNSYLRYFGRMGNLDFDNVTDIYFEYLIEESFFVIHDQD